MSFTAVEDIARAVLYEGYLLYPYRPSALKNRQRWMFGRVLPSGSALVQDKSERSWIQTECLLVGTKTTRVEISVRFLQLGECGGPAGDALGQDAVEREVATAAHLADLAAPGHTWAFSFAALSPVKQTDESCRAAAAASVSEDALRGCTRLVVEKPCPGLFKLTVMIENHTPCGSDTDLDYALLRSLISTHAILRVYEGEFVSLIDPPERYKSVAASCRNVGAWPVLVGSETGRMVLSAPIILYDYPQIAPESPGDHFDGTEIDELLSLRIQTLTEHEKREMRTAGQHASRLLARTESLSEEQLLRLHGRLEKRSSTQLDQHLRAPGSTAGDRPFEPGDRVRLRPKGGADPLDLLLAGEIATIVAVERDFEDRIHLAVVVNIDPGWDLGVQGLPGHRFFFRPDEVERM